MPIGSNSRMLALLALLASPSIAGFSAPVTVQPVNDFGKKAASHSVRIPQQEQTAPRPRAMPPRYR